MVHVMQALQEACKRGMQASCIILYLSSKDCETER